MATFKSRHPNTISFSNESFEKLMDKDWTELTCKMSDGDEVKVSRNQLIHLWARRREYRQLQNGMRVKVLTIR